MKFLGTSDEVSVCDCCGRRDLKSTVALELVDHADPVYYGVVCAARALKLSAKLVKASAREADNRAAAAARRALPKLLDLGDWSRPATEIAKDKVLHEGLLAVAKAAVRGGRR